MKDRFRFLLNISLCTGIIPFVVGWGIFLAWLGGRYLYALDFDDLEVYGFFWMVGCFFVACGGLLVLALYTILNRRRLHRRMAVALAVILVNIPSVMAILPWQEKADQKVFIRLRNNSGADIGQLALMGNVQKTIEIGALKNNAWRVFSYKPDYRWLRDRKDAPDNRLLVTFENGKKDTVAFPQFFQPRCAWLVINGDVAVLHDSDD